MQREIFLLELEKSLKTLPKNEMRNIVNHYRDAIYNADDNQELEDPKIVANTILKSYNINQYDENVGYHNPNYYPYYEEKKKSSVLKIVLAVVFSPIWIPLVLALGGAAIAMVVALLMVVVAVISIPIILITAAIGLIIATIIGLTLHIPSGIFLLGLALICFGVGFLGIGFAKLIIDFVKVIFRKTRESYSKRRSY